MILPLLVMGRPGAGHIMSGVAKGPMDIRTFGGGGVFSFFVGFPRGREREKWYGRGERWGRDGVRYVVG